MSIRNKKIAFSNLKILGLAAVILLAFSGCAVPFQKAETLEKGESEIIVGYTPINSLTVEYDRALTGFSDIGLGVDLVIPFLLHSIGFVSAKQNLLSFNLSNNNYLNLLISGSTGVLLADDELPVYYQGNGMIGLESGEVLITIGGGMLKDPRYSYDLMENKFYDEVYKHLFLGLKIRHFLFQIQFISRGDYGDVANIGMAYCK
jgi:hypothetical protein